MHQMLLCVDAGEQRSAYASADQTLLIIRAPSSMSTHGMQWWRSVYRAPTLLTLSLLRLLLLALVVTARWGWLASWLADWIAFLCARHQRGAEHYIQPG